MVFYEDVAGQFATRGLWALVYFGHDGGRLLDDPPDLILVAHTRTPNEAKPISGTILDEPGEAHLSVKVEVSLLDTLEAAA